MEFKAWFKGRFPNYNGTWMTKEVLEKLLEEAYEEGQANIIRKVEQKV